MEDWMKNRSITDVQTAIQTQTIQTALEANTSKITDAGFQSYLTSAPIPRFWTTPDGNGYPNGAKTTVKYNTLGTFDPYNMLVTTTGFATVPIDGFYSFTFSIFGTAPAGTAGIFLGQIEDTNPSTFTYASSLQMATAGVGMTLNVCSIMPLSAGQRVCVNITSSNPTTVTGGSGTFSGVWIAPYKQYTGGNA